MATKWLNVWAQKGVVSWLSISILVLLIGFHTYVLFRQLVLQNMFSRAHHITLLVKSSVRSVPVLQAGADDHKDIFHHLLSVLHDNGPLGGAAIVLKDDLKDGQVTLVTR